MLETVFRKCDGCGDLEGFIPYRSDLRTESTLCTKCRNKCEHKSAIKKFEYMATSNGVDSQGNMGYILQWRKSTVSNKKRKNILVSTVAEKGVMTLIVDIHCDGCMRWIRIPFYSPIKLFHAQKIKTEKLQ